MKKFRLGRSLMAGVLTLTMLIGTCPTSFAAVSPTEIHYVSLGDSMTNGYGLTNYDGSNGVLDYGDGSYANLFANWLVENDYSDVVYHNQLSMSAILS